MFSYDALCSGLARLAYPPFSDETEILKASEKVPILIATNPAQVLALEAGAGGPVLLQRKLPLLLFQPRNTRGRHTVDPAAARLLCQQGHVAAFSHGNAHAHARSPEVPRSDLTDAVVVVVVFKRRGVFLSQHLPRNQHVVCVDMPGHEGTSRTGVEDYSIRGQVLRIHQVSGAQLLQVWEL